MDFFFPASAAVSNLVDAPVNICPLLIGLEPS